MNDETRAGLHRLKSGWLKADLFRGRSLRKKTRTIEQGFCQQHPSRQWMDPRHNYACSSKRPRCSTTRHQLFIRWSSARAAETLCKRGISTILHIVERKAPLVNSVSSFEITSPDLVFVRALGASRPRKGSRCFSSQWLASELHVTLLPARKYTEPSLSRVERPFGLEFLR